MTTFSMSFFDFLYRRWPADGPRMAGGPARKGLGILGNEGVPAIRKAVGNTGPALPKDELNIKWAN